jgi:hypothetical protein
VALQVAVRSARRKTEDLARAIAGLDFLAAWVAATDLRKTLVHAEELAATIGSSTEGNAMHGVQELRAATEPLLAIAPSPSPAAIRAATSTDRHAPRDPWESEQQDWRAARGASVGAPSKEPAVAGHAPTDAAQARAVPRHASKEPAVAGHAPTAASRSADPPHARGEPGPHHAPATTPRSAGASHARGEPAAGHSPTLSRRSNHHAAPTPDVPIPARTPLVQAPQDGHTGGSQGAAGARDSQAPAAAGPPDLGNYDSATGKHVLVLRTWDNTAIIARRVELQGRLSRIIDPKARDELLREYEAIEWIARERHLALPKDPREEAAPQAFLGGKPIRFWVPDSAQGMRAMLEREMTAGTGYAAAREHAQQRIDYSTTSRSAIDNDRRLIGHQQTALLDHDIAAFRAAFQTEAKHTALAMLDASTVAIDAALRSYGIAGGSFRLTRAAHNVAKDPASLDAEVDQWIALSTHADGNHAALAAGHGKRDDLARQARQLRELQDNIATLAADQLRLTQQVQAQHPEHPGMPRPPRRIDDRQLDALSRRPQPMQGSAQTPFDQLPRPSAGTPEQQLVFVRGALQARQAQFKAAWIQAERAHPVLAAYRGRTAPDASALAGIGADEGTMRSIITQVLPKLGNIYRTKAALQGAGVALDPLQLAPVVELTKQRMFVAQGSARDRAVHDLIEQAHDQHGGLVPWAFDAVMIGLTILTLIPTGGTSAAAGLALTGLAYDLYAGLPTYEDFQLASAAADTDLDALRSLSDAEPSLTPLLLRIVGAGVNLTVAAGIFRRAIALRRMAIANRVDPEALADLNKAGEALGVNRIGDEAITRNGANAAAKVALSSPEVIEIRGYAQGPRLKWAKNPDGSIRTVDEAIEIARKNGVEMPDDILLRKVSGKFLPNNTYADYFRVTSNDPGKIIRWEDFYNKDLDQLLVRVEQSMFESDEAIVAILGHELHELNILRRLFEESGGTMTYRQLHYLINPGIKGNLHDQAWDLADQLVYAMRNKNR